MKQRPSLTAYGGTALAGATVIARAHPMLESANPLATDSSLPDTSLDIHPIGPAAHGPKLGRTKNGRGRSITELENTEQTEDVMCLTLETY